MATDSVQDQAWLSLKMQLKATIGQGEAQVDNPIDDLLRACAYPSMAHQWWAALQRGLQGPDPTTGRAS